MRSTLALAVAFALGLLSRPASAQRTAGGVEYATAGRLYLDAGARDGLAPGAVLALRRGEKAAGTCRVEVVSETHATCLGNGRPGDTFPLDARPEPAEATPARTGAGPLADAEAARRRRTLENATFEPAVARPDADWELYVWEAELVRRPPSGLAVALGRIRPWVAPGATIVDGVQAGWRTKGNVEFGVFGGAVPDPSTTSPAFDRSTGGADLAFQSVGDTHSTVRYAREEFRLAYVNSPELGRRLELEGLEQMSLGKIFDLGIQGRIAKPEFASTLLDSFSADLGFHPLEKFSLMGAFRFQGSSVPEADGPGVINLGGVTRHADVTARWDVVPWLDLAATSGMAEDPTGFSRRFAGPEIGLPRLFGEVGGASAGFLFEDGWSGGHTAWMQILTRRPRGLQCLLRVFWYRTRGLTALAEDELGASASLSAQLGPFVALRLTALGRAGGTPGTQPLAARSLLAGSFDLALAGRF